MQQRTMQRILVVILVATVCLSAPASTRADDTRTAKKESPGVLVLDANPLFLQSLEFPLPSDRIESLNKATAEGAPRKGAAADGVSLLLLRAEFDRAGVAEFALSGDKPQ